MTTYPILRYPRTRRNASYALSRTLSILLICSTFAGNVFGWGKVGHKTVAQIAENLIQQKTLKQVQALLPPDTTLADIALWADEIKFKRPETRGWHFIDIPISDNPKQDDIHSLDSYCMNGNCVIDQIVRYYEVLKSTAPAPARLEALKFVVHLVGDLHQPLHCADDHDRGGNGKQINFLGKKDNLHSLWDHIIQKKDDGDYLILAQSLTPKAREIYQNTVWIKYTSLAYYLQIAAFKSWKIAKQQIYPEFYKTTGNFGFDYQAEFRPIAESQIVMAGVRLAMILDSALR